MKIYVGNLSYGTDEEGLRAAFAAHGEVVAANISLFRDSGRSRGFGFVEMPNDDEAQAAIEAMDGAELDGRTLRVNKSVPKEKGGRGGRRTDFHGHKPHHGGFKTRRNHEDCEEFGNGKWRPTRW